MGGGDYELLVGTYKMLKKARHCGKNSRDENSHSRNPVE